MKADVEYNKVLDNYHKSDYISHVFKYLQNSFDCWRETYNSNCIVYADDPNNRSAWELEDFAENVYTYLLDDYTETYHGLCKNEITLTNLCITNNNFYKLLRNYIK